MKNRICLFAMASAMVFMACEQDAEYTEMTIQSAPSQEFCLDVEMEPIAFELDEESYVQDSKTRSFIDANSSSWNIRLQTDDKVALYYGHMNGTNWSKYYSCIGTYEMTSLTSGKVRFGPVEGLEVNDVLLSHTTTADEPFSGSMTSVPFTIPSEQVTKYEPLTFATRDNNNNRVTTYGTEPVVQAASNAMPRIGSTLRITQAMVDGTKSSAGSISFKPLGSILETRIYSSNASIGVGETIQSVTLTSTDGTQLAGDFTHTIMSTSNMNADGITGTDYVTADVSACEYVVAKNQAGYVPVDMVLAPGTFPATLTVVTDQYRYTVNFESKQYNVGVRKATYVNLSAATRESVHFVPKFNLTSTLTNCICSYKSATEFDPGQLFYAILRPAYGYEFTEGNVTITMGGENVTASAFNYETGKISISQVTGDIDVVANATEIYVPTTYFVSDELAFCKFDEAIEREIVEGESFTASIVPINDTYALNSISVSMDGVDITDEAVIFDSMIFIEHVTGPVLIVAQATKVITDELDDESGLDDLDD